MATGQELKGTKGLRGHAPERDRGARHPGNPGATPRGTTAASRLSRSTTPR